MRLRFATTTATATSQGGHEPPSRRVATPGHTRAAPGLTGSAPAQAKIIDRNIHWLETSMRSGWTLRPEVLRRHLEGSAEGEDISRILVLNSPSNPTGRAHTRDEVKVRRGKRRGEGAPYTQLPPDSAPCAQLLAEVCREHGVIVLSDEIYGETHMDGGHVSIAEYYPEGTIVSHGISKGFGAGGWRLGAHVFPPQLRRLLDAMAVVASETYTSVSAPIQHAACAAYEYPDSVAAYVRDSRRVLKVCPPPVGPLRRRAAGPTPQAPRLWASGAHTRCGRRVWTCWTRWAASTASPPGTATATRWPPAASTLARSWWRRAFETRVRCCRWRGGPTASPRPRAHSSTSPPPPGVAFLPGSDFGRPTTELTARLAFVDFSGELALRGASSLPVREPGMPLRFPAPARTDPRRAAGTGGGRGCARRVRGVAARPLPARGQRH